MHHKILMYLRVDRAQSSKAKYESKLDALLEEKFLKGNSKIIHYSFNDLQGKQLLMPTLY